MNGGKERASTRASSLQDRRFNSAVSLTAEAYIKANNPKRGTRYRESDGVLSFDDDLFDRVKRNLPEFARQVEAVNLVSTRADIGRRIIPFLQEEADNIVSEIESKDARKLFGDILFAIAYYTGRRTTEDLISEANDLLASMGIKEGILSPRLRSIEVRQIVEAFLKGLVEIE